MMMPITQSQRQVNPSRDVVAFSVVTVGITKSISISLLLLCLCEWSDLLEKKSILCILLDYIFGLCMGLFFFFLLMNQYHCIVVEWNIEVLLLTSGFNNLEDCFYLDIIYLLLFVFVLLGIKGKMIWLGMRSFY